MIYFTVSKNVIDSISKDYKTLKNKFPNEKIYKINSPILSIYLNKLKNYEEVFK